MKNNKSVKSNKKHTKEMAIVGGAVLVLCIVLLINSFNLMQQIDERSIIIDNLQAQIEQEQMESQELVLESQQMSDEEYIAQVARERLGLVKPNEIIFQKE